MASMNQTRPHCVNQMGKTHSKPLAARQDKVTVWARHAMCESALTHSLTPCSTVLRKKLTGLQLVKKLPAFYGTWMFITTFTSAHHLSLSWASSIQSISQHPTSWRSILICPPIYVWVFQVVFFLLLSPPKPCIHVYCPPYALHAPPISFFSILPPEQYLVSSADHWAPHYVVFSTPL